MPLKRPLLLALSLLCPLAAVAKDTLPPTLPTQPDSRLMEVATSPHIWNGAAVTADGRTFVSLTQSEGPGMSLAEVGKDGQLHPYPDARWNTWNVAEPGQHFLHVNALRVGPDGKLWAVDAGNTGINTGAHAVQGAGKLVRIDLATNQVDKVYSLEGAVQKDNSYFDDVRFHGRLAYLTDPGAVRLVVLDLDSGKARTLLENHPLSIDHLPMYADGNKLFIPNGEEKRVGLDQLEVSPDGEYLYYQAIPGPLARIATRYVDDPALPPAQVAEHAERWLDTWSTGGTAIDAAGNIYASDVNTRSVKRIAPDKTVTTVVADPRLVWVDALWIQDGYLYLPAAQINRTPATTGGKPSTVQYPVHLYKIRIDAKPSPLDHA
ncbi:L-dopachrome tautomerase-related protein [Pseudomonas sp.]|uniref:SMP-30/gluconolactonase/LRE family protein n=1 Tax=Pseudomonas sp. TaxID=306 RepID=UPI002587EAF6|nr:L-dopachrome tautomerase-related protein [Pseudomonas sp.]